MVNVDDDASPLVTGFPAWDLLPANPLLLRRKPTGVRQNRPKLAAVPPPAIEPSARPAAAPAQTAAAEQPWQPMEATSSCAQCGSALEAGAIFCGECGARAARA
jgi:hypothetical protein